MMTVFSHPCTASSSPGCDSRGSLRLEPAVAIQVTYARGFWQRLRGLIGRSLPPAGHGLVFSQCRQVHTFGMLRAIDVVHLRAGVAGARRGPHELSAVGGAQCTVATVVAAATLQPWRVGRFCRDASMVLEMAPGEAERLGLLPGTAVQLVVAGA